MEHLGFEQRWAVIDLILKTKKTNLPDRTIQYCNSKRPATYCRNVGKRRRWEIALKEEESVENFFDSKTLWKFLSQWVSQDEATIERKTVYTFQSAIAKKWRRGRQFLVGDAAHIVPPTGAKGLNLAFSDVNYLVETLEEYYQEKNKVVLSKYSKRALNRVWKAIRFSWWMTVTFHKFPNQSDFDQKMQETEIEYLENSEIAQKSFAENYVGLPF